MTACTVIATGNAHVAGTWLGGIIPGDGDTIDAVSPYVLTVASGHPLTVGTGGATGTAAITLRSGATMVWNDAVTLKGDLVMEKGFTFTQNPGGNLAFRAPTGARYRVYCNTTGAGTSLWRVIGTSGTPVTMTSNSTDGGSNGFVLIDEISQANCVWEYYNWQYIGDSGQDAINYTDWSTQSFYWSHGLVLNCGRTNWGFNQTNSSFRLQYIDYREPLNATFCRVIGNAAFAPSGTTAYTPSGQEASVRQITNMTAYKAGTTITFDRMLRDLTVTNPVLVSTSIGDLDRRTIRVTGEIMVMERSGTGEGFGASNDCWISESAFISNFDNPHHISESSGTGVGVTNRYFNNFFDNFGVFVTDYGDNVIPRGLAEITGNMHVNVSGVAVTVLSAAPIFKYEHNTCVGARGINFGEGADAATTCSSLQSNLFVSQNAGLLQDVNFVTKDASFVMGHNGYYNMTASSNVDYAGNNTYLGVATSTWKTGATYGDVGFGAGDVYANPQLVDGTRTAATWDSANGGPGTLAHIRDEVLKLNGRDSTGAAAAFNSSYSAANLLTYIRAGLTPTNAAISTAAHDGTTIGAVAYAAAVAANSSYYLTHRRRRS
jgi:hypothetical protein